MAEAIQEVGRAKFFVDIGSARKLELAYGCPGLQKFLLKFLLMGVLAQSLNVLVPYLAPGQPPKVLSLRTTMIYAHVLNRGGRRVLNAADKLMSDHCNLTHYGIRLRLPYSTALMQPCMA
jgi:hypothetical protein